MSWFSVNPVVGCLCALEVVTIALLCGVSTYLALLQSKEIEKWNAHQKVWPSDAFYRAYAFYFLSILFVAESSLIAKDTAFKYMTSVLFSGITVILLWMAGCSPGPFLTMKTNGYNVFGYAIASIATLILIVNQIVFMADICGYRVWITVNCAVHLVADIICTIQYLKYAFAFLLNDSVFSGGVPVFYEYLSRIVFKVLSRVIRYAGLCLLLVASLTSSVDSGERRALWRMTAPIVVSFWNIGHFLSARRNRPMCRRGDCYGLGDVRYNFVKRIYDGRHEEYKQKHAGEIPGVS